MFVLVPVAAAAAAAKVIRFKSLIQLVTALLMTNGFRLLRRRRAQIPFYTFAFVCRPTTRVFGGIAVLR